VDATSNADPLEAKQARGSGGINLTTAATLASWPTPNAGPQNDTDTKWQERRAELKAQHKNGNGFGLTLGMAASLASWLTPATTDAFGTRELDGKRSGGLNTQAQTSGAPATGSPAQTEKRGQLNPAFSRWLQGYPVSWCQAAIRASRLRTPARKRGSDGSGATATASNRKRPRSSSKRISTP
jgi:hypothetical protein